MSIFTSAFGWLFKLMGGGPGKYIPRRQRPSKSNRKPAKWLYTGVGMCLAWTRSEARAKFKKHLGLSRLPPGRTPQRISSADIKEKRR
jgi:hypothetical protein